MAPEYLRISVTARCNLACRYCTGEHATARAGQAPEPPPETTGFLVRCAAAEGVRKVRLTGGEPLVRDDLEEIVRAVSSVAEIAETTLTTNGIGLDARAGALAAAGLSRVNISLDTLRRDRFRRLTGKDLLAEVLAGIDAAGAAFEEVRLNTVLVGGLNDDEIEKLVRFAAGRGLRIRFIEQYGACGASRTASPDAGEIRRRIEAAFGELMPLAGDPLSIERVLCLPSLGGATVGIISSRSSPPCAGCTRLRFTSEGRLRGCLFDTGGEDVARALAAGDEKAVRGAIRRVFASKRRAGAGRPWVGSPVRLVGG